MESETTDILIEMGFAEEDIAQAFSQTNSNDLEALISQIGKSTNIINLIYIQ